MKADHREVLGESIRALSAVPALALDYKKAGSDCRDRLGECLMHGGAICLRVVLSARSLPTPTAAEALGLVDQNPMSGLPLSDWTDKDALWGRVANVMFHTGESAHVTDDVEADCIGSLGTLAACIEFLRALEIEGLKPWPASLL